MTKKMSLDKMNLDKLTLENVEAQFCSDWLKRELRALLVGNARLQEAVEVMRKYESIPFCEPVTQRIYYPLREALAKLDQDLPGRKSERCKVCGKEGPTRYGGTCSRQCEKEQG